jgi:hypothetical protein
MPGKSGHGKWQFSSIVLENASRHPSSSSIYQPLRASWRRIPMAGGWQLWGSTAYCASQSVRAAGSRHRHSIRLRLAGRAAALGHVPLKQSRQPAHDLRMLLGGIPRFADVGGQFVELDRRQLARLVLAGLGLAPSARIGAERQLPSALRMANEPLME